MRPVSRPDDPLEQSTSSSGRARKKPKHLLDDQIAVGNTMSSSNKADLYCLWRGYLIAYWGKYCSYCEIPMGTALHVEHRLPKSEVDNGAVYADTDWSNMLLACASCNTRKSNKNDTVSDFQWPDDSIWLSALVFSPDPTKSDIEYYKVDNGPVMLTSYSATNVTSTANIGTTSVVLARPGTRFAAQSVKMQKTIDLVQLNNNYDSSTGELSYNTKYTDRRILFRTRAWEMASQSVQRLNTINTTYKTVSPQDTLMRNLMERQIIATAISAGFWSVWMTVFYQAAIDNPSRLALADGDTLPNLLTRLFITGTPALDILFKGTDANRVNLTFP